VKRLVTVMLAVVVLSALVPAAPSGAGSPLVLVGRAGGDYSIDSLSAVTTSTGVTLVTWLEYFDSPNRLVLRRQEGTERFERIPLDVGGLDVFNSVSVVEDVGAGRILLVAAASQAGDLGGTLGLYVWTSQDQGRSWSGPTKVWDSFGTAAQIALDGAGGFWAVSGLTWVEVVHVPADFSQQFYPDDAIRLSEVISSRGYLGLATTGPDRTLLFPYQRAVGAGMHVSAAVGPEHDINIFRRGAVVLATAGDARQATVLSIHPNRYVTGATARLYARQVRPADGDTVSLGAERVLSRRTEDVVDFAVSAIPGRNGAASGRFLAVWRTFDADLRLVRSNRDGTWSAPQDVVSFPRGQYSNPSALGVTSRWTFVQAYDGAFEEVVVATRTPAA
jgi:hypothetical protein